MKIKRLTWINLLVLACLSIAVWYKFSYPQIAFLNLSVDRNKALYIAEDFLHQRDVDTSQYITAISFQGDGKATRYLQKTLGFNGLLEFVKKEDLDLFYWKVRFFREGKKEGFRVIVSSATGEVIAFNHALDDSFVSKTLERDKAKEIAINFLKNKFSFNPEQYSLKGDLLSNLEYRSDYSFTWKKNDVNISWSDEPNSGTGHMLMSTTLTGSEVRAFSKNALSLPNQFNRDLSKRSNIGGQISNIVKIFYYTLFIAAVYFLIKRINHLAMHSTKKFYLGIVGISFLLSLLANFNQFENILYGISTTSPLKTQLFHIGLNQIIGALMVTIALIMPALSGELLHFESFRDRKEGSFLFYVQSTFLSHSVARSITMGYLLFMIMLGLQSLLIKFGQDHWGVWIQHNWMTQNSSAYLPFLAAFTIGFKASFNEEIMFRLFAISWGKKLFKNTIIAVIVSSLIWGFAHSYSPVFPMWFRGIEVSCLGFLLSFMYLRFGLIVVITAHYLFNVFWNSAGYLLGQSQPFYFWSSLFVLLIPLGIAIVTFMVNKQIEERPLRWQLNKHQLFNLDVLRAYLQSHPEILKEESKEAAIKKVTAHGWDIAVVDVAMSEMFENKD